MTRLTDGQMVQQYPLLGTILLTLAIIGLACDGYLVWQYRQRQARQQLRVSLCPWGLHQIAVCGLLYVGAQILVAMTASLAVPREQLAWVLVLSGNLVVNLGLVIGILGYCRRQHTDGCELFGLGQASNKRIWQAGLMFYFAMIPPLIAASMLSTWLCTLLGIPETPQPVVTIMATTESTFLVIMIVILAVVVAPIAEETLFRGFAYPALKQRYGTAPALLAVSLCFALAHGHLPSVGVLFALGLAFGLAYELTGSIVTPMIMHALFNATSVLMLVYVRMQG